MDRGEKRARPEPCTLLRKRSGRRGRQARRQGDDQWEPSVLEPEVGDVKKTEEVAEARQLLQGAQDRGTGSGDRGDRLPGSAICRERGLKAVHGRNLWGWQWAFVFLLCALLN